MPCVLTVIYSIDSHDSAAFVRNHQVYCNESIDLVCLDELQFPLKPSRIQNMARSKLFVVLISPSLLQFLQKRPEDAFSVHRLVKPASTSVIFCNYAKESDVTSQHKLVLSSFEKWSKFLPDEKLQKKKSFQLMNQPISQISVNLNVETLIVPLKATSEQNCIYAIFDKPVADMEHLSIFLEKNGTVEVSWKKTNPYVASFIISDAYFETPGKIKVHIRHEGKVIDIKDLLCEEDQTVVYSDCICVSPESTTLNSTHDHSSFEQESTSNLLKLCAKYGLEHFAADVLEDKLLDKQELNEASSLENDNEPYDGPSIDECETKHVSGSQDLQDNSYNDEEDWVETSSFKSISLRQKRKNFRKSSSLPSLCIPREKIDSYTGHWMDVEEDKYYIDMSGKPGLRNKDLKPHERLLKEIKHQESCPYEDINIESLLSNHTYTSLRAGKRASEKAPYMSDLSKSQQELVELLHAFKRGVKTISEVERLFQDWHIKHRRSLTDQACVMKQKYGKVQRRPSFKLMPDFKGILSKPKRKDSKDYQTDQIRRKNENLKDLEVMRKNRHLETLSMISNSSTSSHCSMISEHSGTVGSNNGLTTDSGTLSDGTDSGRRGRNIKNLEENLRPWVYAYPSTSETMYCPLFPWEDYQPPLPPRPPPLPARRKVPPVKPLNTNKKPKVMPRKKLLKKYRCPSPDYITPNEHKLQQIILKKETSKQIKKSTFLLPLPAWKSEYRKETKMEISSPLRKISAPTFHFRKVTPSSDLEGRIIADLEEAKLIHKSDESSLGMRKSQSYPQFRDSVFQ